MKPSHPGPAPRPGTVTYRQATTGLRPTIRSGDVVTAEQPLGMACITPPPTIVDLTGALKRSPKALADTLHRLTNTSVEQGALLGEAGGPFGLGNRQARSPVAGRVVEVLDELGAVIIQEDAFEQQEMAAAPGVVSRVDETFVDIDVTGTIITAAAGTGQEVWGVLALIAGSERISDEVRAIVDVADITPPRVIALRNPFDLKTAKLVKDAYWRPDRFALIVPSMPYDDYLAIQATLPQISLIVVHGFGVLSFADSDGIWAALEKARGRSATILPSGAGEYPVVVLPGNGEAIQYAGRPLAPGDSVHILHGLALQRAVVLETPSEPHLTPSGRTVPAVRVALASGAIEVVERQALTPAGRANRPG